MSHIRCRRLALSSFFLKTNPWTTTLSLVGAEGTRGIASASRLRQEVKEELDERESANDPKLGISYDTHEREAEVGDTVSRTLAKQESKRLKSDLRSLLRNIGQPVAVVTSFMPTSRSSTDPDNGIQNENASPYHGATLSSFTSIAMDPYPLVAFALRIPSRMASALTSLSKSSSPSSSMPITASSQATAHMVINLLSASQASAAVKFSRPDLYPKPFHGSSSTGTKGIPYKLSQDGLPVIDGIIGALSCRLVGGPIPLYDLGFLERDRGPELEPRMPVLGKGEVGSELFIARVLRVETVSEGEELEDGDERTLPLVYHRSSYTTCQKE